MRVCELCKKRPGKKLVPYPNDCLDGRRIVCGWCARFIKNKTKDSGIISPADVEKRRNDALNVDGEVKG